MPWLVKDKPELKDRLFFVHVPRCGGTSLMHHFDVPSKAMHGQSCWNRFGMRVFFHRYKLLESTNFPIFTAGNGACVVVVGLGGWLSTTCLRGLGIFLCVTAGIFFLCLSFLFTAPTICRLKKVRRCYLVFVDWILCRFMESIEWCTGTNRTGYIMHLTAGKLLAYGYVTVEEMDHVCSMAIVRNPYSRMVSLYHYNRFGSCESFAHFLADWHRNVFATYRDRGELDEWHTPCHALPMFEFTHYEGHQLVQSIVKQEELKYLKTIETRLEAIVKDSSVADLPDPVRDALLGMPHTNRRDTAKKWYDYYDQASLDLVYEMYQRDFEVFGYSPILQQRPDLKAPKGYSKDVESAASVSTQAESSNPESIPSATNLEHFLRDSSKSDDARKSLRRSLLLDSSSRRIMPARHECRSSMFVKAVTASLMEDGNCKDDRA